MELPDGRVVEDSAWSQLWLVFDPGLGTSTKKKKKRGSLRKDENQVLLVLLPLKYLALSFFRQCLLNHRFQ